MTLDIDTITLNLLDLVPSLIHKSNNVFETISNDPKINATCFI